MMMRPVLSAVLLAAFLTTQATYGIAAPKHRDTTKEAENSDCVVTGRTDWSITKPIFKCPEQEPPARRKQNQ